MPVLNTSTACVVLFIVLSAVLLYRWALPKPIPGIPYDQKSASRILGDLPDALKHLSETQEMVSFLVERCEKLDSPVIQVFLRPFQRPRVVVMDGREWVGLLICHLLISQWGTSLTISTEHMTS